MSRSSARVPKALPPERPAQLAVNLKALRDHHGWSLERVGTAVGATRGAVHGWETGAYAPGEEFVGRLASLYGVAPADLRYRDADDLILERSAAVAKQILSELEPDASGEMMVFKRPRISLGIPQRIRVWIGEFLLELIKAGVTEDEVSRVRDILSADELYRFYAGGEPKEYSEEETLKGLQGHAEGFRRELRRRGYKIPK